MNNLSDMRGVPTRSSTAGRELTLLLRRNRWRLLASVALGLLVGAIIAARVQPAYEGSALILLTEPRTEVVGLSAASPVTPARLATEIELLRSSALAKAVVDSLGLQVNMTAPQRVQRNQLLTVVRTDPYARLTEYRLSRGSSGAFTVEDATAERQVGTVRAGEQIELPQATLLLSPTAAEHETIEFSVASSARAVTNLLEDLEVGQPGEEANLIRVTYRARDPQIARDVPNALTAQYMALGETVEKSEARTTAVFLREQLDTLSTQLTQAEDQLRTFRESAQVVNPDVEATTLLSQLAQLETQRATLEADRAGLAGLVADVQAHGRDRSPAAPSPYRRLIAFPALLRNNAASELLRSLTEAEAEQAALAVRRTSDDPDMQDVNARVTAIEQQLLGVASTYLQGLNSQVAAMNGAIGQISGELAQAPGDEVEFARLSRQPRVLEEMHDLLQTRLKEAEIAQAVEDRDVRVIDQADLPAEPVPGQRSLVIALFGLIGALVGVGRVAVKEYNDTAVHSRAELEAATGTRVIGLIPEMRTGDGARRRLRALNWSRVLPSNGSDNGKHLEKASDRSGLPTLMRHGPTTSLATDAFGRLHTGMRLGGSPREPKVLLFASPLQGDEKTTTAAGYAVTLAQLGLKVLLIDGDLRHGKVHEAFGVDRGPGLSDLLKEEPTFEGTLRSVHVGSGQPLRYITSGEPPENPMGMLLESVLSELIAVAADEYDRVIVDSPPLMAFPDAGVISSCVDGVVLVARAGVTPFDALAESADQIRHSGAPLVGAVLNGVDYERDRGYDRSYRWQDFENTHTPRARKSLSTDHRARLGTTLAGEASTPAPH